MLGPRLGSPLLQAASVRDVPRSGWADRCATPSRPVPSVTGRPHALQTLSAAKASTTAEGPTRGGAPQHLAHELHGHRRHAVVRSRAQLEPSRPGLCGHGRAPGPRRRLRRPARLSQPVGPAMHPPQRASRCQRATGPAVRAARSRRASRLCPCEDPPGTASASWAMAFPGRGPAWLAKTPPSAGHSFTLARGE